MEETDKDIDKHFFYVEGVDKGCEAHSYKPIAVRFDTLINANCEKPFDWYKELGLDKSVASRIRRGLVIPPRWMRIQIAQYFKTDSATIWANSDLPYIRKILKNQRGDDYE